MRIGTVAAAGVSLFAVLACGGSATSPRPGAVVASSATITRYQDLAAGVQSAAVSYGTTMGGPGMTLGGCSATHDAYDAQVRQWISQMVQMSGALDAYMDAHDGYAYADMACVANAMLQELDAHRLVACTFPTLGGDQSEATRHVGVVTSFAGHAYDRCGQMMGGQDAWGPTAPVCGGITGGTPTDPVALGQRIFDTGIGTSGQPLVRTGGYGMMMTSGCASCHGYDGLGRTMMMFTTPNITYANLTDPLGMLDPGGSRGPTYTDELIRRAVTQGLDADGSTLSTIMPRWQLGDLDWADLLLFLNTLPNAASGGSGGTPPPAASGTISGTVFMGGMRSGAIAAYGVNDGVMGPLLGTSSVDASGSFGIPVGGYAGAIVLRMTGGTFVDEATGTTMTMQPGDVVTSPVPSFTAGSAMTGVQVTPLTSMAQARAQEMAGGMTAANIAAANTGVGNYFSVGDILMAAPMDPAVAGAGAAAGLGAKNYGMTIAAMSQYAQTAGLTYSSSVMFTAMMRDASDGVMNGMMGSTPISMGGMGGGMMGGGGAMGGYVMPATAGTGGLATAMTTFVGSSRNASGVSIADIQPLIDRLEASSGAIQ